LLPTTSSLMKWMTSVQLSKWLLAISIPWSTISFCDLSDTVVITAVEISGL
jgi:hypothetical protein